MVDLRDTADDEIFNTTNSNKTQLITRKIKKKCSESPAKERTTIVRGIPEEKGFRTFGQMSLGRRRWSRTLRLKGNSGGLRTPDLQQATAWTPTWGQAPSQEVERGLCGESFMRLLTSKF